MRMWTELVRTLRQGITRIFGPNDDNYPQTGVQPYQGDTDDAESGSYYHS